VVSGPYAGFIEIGRRFAIRVREDLKRRQGLGANTIFFAYDTGALEAFEWCRGQGIKCILNQMDPNRVEVDLVRAEEQKWLGWALQPVAVPEEYFVRREQEWALADRIVVNSEFSRQALLQQSVPAEKLVVIPLCFETKAENRKQKSEIKNEVQLSAFQISASTPLRVLFLGQVILRKGIQYLMAAARQLEKESIRFDIVGPVGISETAMATAPKNVKFHGRTGRDQAANWYRQSQVFVLPTLSDGFALTQLEAMAHGLPVVTTPCCGEVVSDRVDGFIVPPRDVESLVQVFQRYLAEPELLRSQAAAALVKARQFTSARLAENLLKLEAALR
jgi:glycosyltransferase involved in cell wall biosynthesis